MTELFNGFVWPVPIAFKSALEQGMFVEGDCLYDNQVAYLEPWNSARNKLKYSIQVTFPRGSSASVLPDNSRRAADDTKAHSNKKLTRSVFARNWSSSLEYTLYDRQANRQEPRLTTTQGRLFRLLQTGDISVLGSESPIPKVPKSLSDLRLNKSVSSTIEEALRGLSDGELAFVMPFDRRNSVSIEKFSTISGKMRQFDAATYDLSLSQAGINNPDSYFPTILIKCFVVNKHTPQDVHDALKKILYKPNQNNESNKDRFRLERHGRLLNLRH